MLQYCYQDILKVESGIIAHGVNCQGVMGSGIAKQIREKWPEVYNSYKKFPQGKQSLGLCQLVNVSPSTSCEWYDKQLWIANCFTQEFYGRDNKQYASPQAIQDSLEAVFQHACLFDLTVHLPKIGCGLGGLDWEQDVEPIINYWQQQYKNIYTTIYTWR